MLLINLVHDYPCFDNDNNNHNNKLSFISPLIIIIIIIIINLASAILCYSKVLQYKAFV